MPLTVNGAAERNLIDIPDALLRGVNGVITLNGENAVVRIGRGTSVAGGLAITVGDGSSVTIGEHCRLGRMVMFSRAGGAITIGNAVGFNGAVQLLVHEQPGISIGDACLIAGDVTMMSSDMHPILDLATGERINPARPIVLEKQVWVGAHATLLKGTRIGTGSVVGFGTVVGNVDVPPHSLVAGVPGRVIRSGITWRRKLD